VSETVNKAMLTGRKGRDSSIFGMATTASAVLSRAV